MAAFLAFIATMTLANAAMAGSSPSMEVAVVTTDVPGGVALQAGQVEVRSVPTDVVPGQALTSAEQVVGRVPAGTLTSGSIITEAGLVGPSMAADADGEVIVPARLSDAGIVGMLQVGDTIDVVATDASTGEVSVVAHGARIATVPDPDAGALGDVSDSTVLVLLAVGPEEASALTRAAAVARLSVMLS